MIGMISVPVAIMYVAIAFFGAFFIGLGVGWYTGWDKGYDKGYDIGWQRGSISCTKNKEKL